MKCCQERFDHYMEERRIQIHKTEMERDQGNGAVEK